MKIIDAHLHMRRHAGFDSLCRQSGHQNSLEHLTDCFSALDVRGCIVMGSAHAGDDPSEPGLFDLGGVPDLGQYQYPKGIAFCVGVEPAGLAEPLREATLARYEQALSCPNCVGFKIYLGYHPYYADDPLYHPVYELAQRHDVTVVFHTGDTATAGGRLKFSHPLTIDEAAVRFPRLRMVLAHFGNPWLCDAAEVVKKNPNVFADLSGLAVGIPDTADFRQRYAGYVFQLECWLGYLDQWDNLLYGTDWPLVNLEAYSRLIASIVPGEHHEKVFYQNALRAFPRLKALVE